MQNEERGRHSRRDGCFRLGETHPDGADIPANALLHFAFFTLHFALCIICFSLFIFAYLCVVGSLSPRATQSQAKALPDL
jgi:hypothetical protein